MPKSKKITKKDLRQNIKENGWKQGSCLLILRENLSVDDKIDLEPGLYVVITQDCDLLCDSIIVKPRVELLYAKELSKKNGNYVAGKNPRKLHFSIKYKQKIKQYECLIKNRYFIDRNVLKNIIPSLDYMIDDETKELLIRWIIKRYNRTAFPDNFNKRIDKSKKTKIQKLLKIISFEVYDIYIQLSTFNELSNEECYAINLYMLVKDETKDQKIMELSDILEQIVSILDECKICIEDDYRVIRLSDISYGKVLDAYLWDFEYLSYQ